MNSVYTILKLNMTILLKDKLSFFWSIALPIIILFLNANNIKTEFDLVFWWIYMFINSFIFGVGLYALSERDTGYLSIIFSIKWIPLEFFFGSLMTQIFYNILCFIIFNLLASIIFKFSFLYLCFLSTVSLIMTIPVAFLGYNLTYIKNAHSSTLNSISSIFIFLLFILLGIDNDINKYNPLVIIADSIFKILNKEMPMTYILISIFLIILSVPSIIYFKPLSTERR